jgi:hypothetical protein
MRGYEVGKDTMSALLTVFMERLMPSHQQMKVSVVSYLKKDYISVGCNISFCFE